MHDDPAPTFTIDEIRVDGVVILSVSDVLDLTTAPTLATEIRAKLAQSPNALIVDLTQVTFLASAGITVLIKGQEQAGTTVRFGVVAEGSATSRPIKLLGLDDTLALYPTLDDALRELR